MNDAPAPETEQPDLLAMRKRYRTFLKNNETARLIALDVEGERKFVIAKPWNDSSLALLLPESDSELLKALNRVYLPPRYTALYHKAKKALEIIWTAWKLDDTQAEIESRSFELMLPGGNFNCKFAASSKELLTIAPTALPLEISQTGFRNLHSFARFVQREGVDPEDSVGFGSPLSFWIESVEWDDDTVIDLVRHVNFYLRYYDGDSPTVTIHPTGTNETAPRNRYLEGFGFPQKVSSPMLDSKLLILYNSAFEGAVSTNFLNLFSHP